LSTVLKAVEMLCNPVSHPKVTTLSLADGHINANNVGAGMEPEIPWIGVDVGKRCPASNLI